MLPLNPAMAATFRPPVMEARRWLEGVSFAPERPLINVSQAAPVDPPPDPLRQAMAEALLNRPDAHLYGPVLGLPALRAEIAKQWSQAYGGTVLESQTGLRLPYSPTQRVGAEPMKAFEPHRHIHRLWSMDKVQSREELLAWLQR